MPVKTLSSNRFELRRFLPVALTLLARLGKPFEASTPKAMPLLCQVVSIGLDEVFPLWAICTNDVGGLDYNSRQIGQVLLQLRLLSLEMSKIRSWVP